MKPGCRKFSRKHRESRKLLLAVVAVFLITICLFTNKADTFALYIYHRMLSNSLYEMTCKNGGALKDHLYFSFHEGYIKQMANCIWNPPVGGYRKSYPVLEESLTKPYLELPEPKRAYTDTLLILTPLRDAAPFIEKFTDVINTLTYPHELIRISFAEEGSTDNSFNMALKAAEKLRNEYKFKDAVVHKLPFVGNKNPRWNRHNKKIQFERRSHLAKVRNALTKLAFRNDSWILWLDVDVVKLRPDTVQQFLFSNKDVMVASVYFQMNPFFVFRKALAYDLFERNTFNETLHDGQVHRIYTSDIISLGREVPIQFTGSCVMMIRGKCVQNGLHFPEEYIRIPGVVNPGLESEGLGLLANKMGFGVYALPFLEAFHE